MVSKQNPQLSTESREHRLKFLIAGSVGLRETANLNKRLLYMRNLGASEKGRGEEKGGDKIAG